MSISDIDSSVEVSRKRKIGEVDSGDDQSASGTHFGSSGNHSTTSDTDELCSRCSGIDLDEIFRRQLKRDSFVMNLGSIAALKLSQCRMCRMFASFAPEDLSPELDLTRAEESLLRTGLCHLRIFGAGKAFTGFEERKISGKDVQETNILAVAPSESNSQEIKYMDYTNLRGLLREKGYLSLKSPFKPLSICNVRTIDPRVFDFNLASTWMSYCHAHHRTRCSRQTSAQIRRFRVLDCRSREVTDAPARCDYVALSYVWAKQSPHMRPSPDCPSPDPTISPEKCQGRFEKVIEDSITVAQNLGVHYLWVDKICIDQADSEDKHQQIGQMDLIYANSVFTIIAAAGDGPDHGLPGVNKTPRAQQPAFKFGDKILLSTLPDGGYTIRKSRWNTRGWTFQESVLSTRRLIFTETQVLFECNGMHCSEALDVPLDALHVIKRTKFDNLAYRLGALPSKAPGSNSSEFMEYVADYSSRDLSFRQDALNAFQGVLNAFQRYRQPVHNFWGVPIFLTDRGLSHGYGGRIVARSMSARFAISLFWRMRWSESRTHTRTRIGFPSWSWLGWDSHVVGHLNVANMDKGCFADVRIWIEDGQKEMSFDDPDFCSRIRSLPRVSSIVIQIEGWTIDVGLMDLDFNSRELARFAKEKAGWSYEPERGPHVSFSMGSHGMVYSKVEGRDMDWTASPDRPLLGFLPSSYRKDRGSTRQQAMLLEKVGDHYERVGFFKPCYCWKWDGQDQLQNVVDMYPRLDSTRQLFRLG